MRDRLSLVSCELVKSKKLVRKLERENRQLKEEVEFLGLVRGEKGKKC